MHSTDTTNYGWLVVFADHPFAFAILFLLALGILKLFFRERTAADWPIVEGTVQTARVVSGEGRDHAKHAIIAYSYYLGQYESGEYVRSFLREEPAYAFADGLRDKKVTVHYNPKNSSDSTLKIEELERLLPVRTENSST